MPAKRTASYTPRGPVAKRSYTRVASKRAAYKAPVAMYGAAGDAKYHDVAYASYANDTTGSITHLDIVPRNTSVTGRDGKAFKPTSFQFQGMVVANSGATTANKWMNLLVWDYQPNKALAGITDILDATTAYALPNRDNAGRFKIIRRWDGVITGDGDNPATENAVPFNGYIKLPHEAVSLTTGADTTGAIGFRSTGALLFVTVGNVVAGSAAAFTNMTGRVNFADI